MSTIENDRPALPSVQSAARDALLNAIADQAADASPDELIDLSTAYITVIAADEPPPSSSVLDLIDRTFRSRALDRELEP
ncbi:hypothetical protein GCM10027589_27040 [Actinocorallia lasiicapitis]